jgi:hypothetical protein
MHRHIPYPIVSKFTLWAAIALKGLNPNDSTIKNFCRFPPILTLLQCLDLILLKPFFQPSELFFVELFKLDLFYYDVLLQSYGDL